MDLAYILNRNKSYINKYKLNRRSQQIFEAIENLSLKKELSLLDIGSADGYLLSFLNNKLGLKQAVGIEPSLDCIGLKTAKNINLVAGVGETLPFSDSAFDIIVAASVIDHLKDVNKFLIESRRVLRKNGLLIITAIIPFYDKMANIFKIDNGLHPHIKTFSLSNIKEVLESHNFGISLAKRFALPSFGLIPFERSIELVLEKLNLNQFMFYSIVVGRRL